MRGGKAVAILGVDILADDIYRMQQEIQHRMILVLCAGALFCCVLGILISGSVSGPVRKLTEGTRQLAKDNLHYRVEIRSRDEIGELADSFNAMAANLSESRERLQDYFSRSPSRWCGRSRPDPYCRAIRSAWRTLRAGSPWNWA